MNAFHIDWFSFTVPTVGPLGHPSEETFNSAIHVLGAAMPELFPPVTSEGWELEKPRHVYAAVYRHSDSKIAVLYGPVNNHIQVELSGRACAFFDEHGLLENLVKGHGARANRIDLARDFESDFPVFEFARNRNETTTRSYSEVSSPDGDTAYVGSRKSERMCRVYRYNHPHPRSGLLRVEVELKGEAAKAASALVAADGVDGAGWAVNERYQWSSPPWSEAPATGAFRVERRSARTEASRLRWLLNTALPALQTALREGLLLADDVLPFLTS